MHILGEEFATVRSIFAVQQAIAVLISSKTGKVIDPERQRTCPDHMFFQSTSASGAVVSITTPTPPRLIDGRGPRWLISGTVRGTIRRDVCIYLIACMISCRDSNERYD